jgi:hypothetical protein
MASSFGNPEFGPGINTDQTQIPIRVTSVFHPWLPAFPTRISNLGIRSWLRTHPWTLLAVLILLIHAVPFLLKHHSEWDEVYLRAAGRLLYGGDVYRFEDGYSYPPFMAWLAIPFVFLPQAVSRALWLGINIGCLVGMWRLAWRLTGGGALKGNQATDKREHLICFLGIACSVRYALNGIAHHQTDLVISVLLLGGCWMLSHRRDWSAASCFGLAAAMKCTALLWCPYLLWKGKWKAAGWVVTLAVGVNLLPNLVRPPERGGLWLEDWLTRYIRPLTAADHNPGDWGSWIIYNQSIAGAANRWLTTEWSWHGSQFEVTQKPDTVGPWILKCVVYGSEAILVIGAAIAMRHRRIEAEGQGGGNHFSGEVLEYGLVLLLMVLLSPMSSKPHFSTLVLPGFALARLAVYEGNKMLRCLLGVALVIAALSLPLWGPRFDFIALWQGSDMWNALLLLIGCGYALWIARSSHVSSQGFTTCRAKAA